jgi:hypothetical protein
VSRFCLVELQLFLFLPCNTCEKNTDTTRLLVLSEKTHIYFYFLKFFFSYRSLDSNSFSLIISEKETPFYHFPFNFIYISFFLSCLLLWLAVLARASRKKKCVNRTP